MKIVISANTSWYVLNFRKNLILTLLKAGHQVFVIAPPDDYVDKLVQLGIKYHPLELAQRSKNPFREIASCVRLFRLLQTIQPDVVLTFTVKCNLYTGICRRFIKFGHIANISGLGEIFEKDGIINFLVSCLYKFSLAGSNRVFFQNDEDMKTIIERHLLPKNLCKRIPGSGVDLETYHPASSPSKNDRRIFLMYGRLVPSKGYDLFMKAAEDICLSKNYNAEFWIMGIIDKSRGESKKLLERILALQEKGVIRYLPPSDEVATVLQQVDAVILPSKYNEGVPRSLLEAMACGKPIITTAWKGCRDTVEHGLNGYLVDIDDSASLTRYIVELINAPQQKLREMGKAGRQKAEAQFDEKHVLRAYMEEIHERALSIAAN